MDTEGKLIWAALCRSGATEEDRSEAADQRAQADEEKAEAERNIAESDQLKEAAQNIRVALGFPKESIFPGEALQVMHNRVVQHQNAQNPPAMSEEESEEMEDEKRDLRAALGFPKESVRSASVKSLEAELAKAVDKAGLGPKDQMGMKGRTLWLSDGKGEILIYDTTARGTVLNYKGKEYRSVKDVMKALGRRAHSKEAGGETEEWIADRIRVLENAPWSMLNTSERIGVEKDIKRLKAELRAARRNAGANLKKEAGRLNLGRVVQTRGVSSKSRENRVFGKEVQDAFRKYQRGDWGDTERDSVKRNNAVLKDGAEDQVFAVYNTSEGKMYIITEWDGSATTMLFSHEY